MLAHWWVKILLFAVAATRLTTFNIKNYPLAKKRAYSRFNKRIFAYIYLYLFTGQRYVLPRWFIPILYCLNCQCIKSIGIRWQRGDWMKHRLSFAYFNKLAGNILEIVVDDKIEISLEMIEECHQFIIITRRFSR